MLLIPTYPKNAIHPHRRLPDSPGRLVTAMARTLDIFSLKLAPGTEERQSSTTLNSIMFILQYTVVIIQLLKACHVSCPLWYHPGVLPHGNGRDNSAHAAKELLGQTLAQKAARLAGEKRSTIVQQLQY